MTTHKAHNTEVHYEWQVLTSASGRELLEEANRTTVTLGATILEQWRKRLGSSQLAAAAMRLALARSKGADKFERASAMWLHTKGIEQATSELVARHKASRLANANNLVVDLCSGVGGDAIALANQAHVIAVDQCLGMCQRVLWNAQVYHARERLLAVRAQAETFALPSRAQVHIDPDRRAGKSRAYRVDGYAPNFDFLRKLMKRPWGCAIKLGPSSDFDRFEEHAEPEGLEIEIVSAYRECKEAIVWSGPLAQCRRKACALPHNAVWTDRDSTSQIPGLAPLSRWIHEPDPALTRSGLFDGFAATLGLPRFEKGIDWLTSDSFQPSPWLTSFEVLESLPLDEKKLRDAALRWPASSFDVKTRGVNLSPEQVRANLKGKIPLQSQAEPLTLILFGGQTKRFAVLARRRS